MAELQLEGYTLGQRHQYYNRLVEDGIKKNKGVNAEDFKLEDSDVMNLLNIDIASHDRNVQYILKVLTCNDMLYVSRAIKKLDWLINDQKYAHIVNPKYLRTMLFPQMCTKAIIKLVKHIRCILNDENRAEEFLSYEENPEEAVKWLPLCSLEFIHENMTKYIEHIKTTLLKRLCEKSITVLEIYIENVASHKKVKALQSNMFLLSSNVDKFLDLVEANEFPKFNKKATNILIKNNPNRVIAKFDQYFNFIHLPTFINCLKQEDIKDFLMNQAQNFTKYTCTRRFNFNRFLLFIQLMPQTIRFEIVKEVFIDKTHESKDNALSEKEIKAMSILCDVTSYLSLNNNYIWYQFAPFDIALQKLQESIASISSNEIKINLLEVVLTSAQNNLSHEHIFIEYLRDNQEHFENNIQENILSQLILKNNFIMYNINTWNILDDVFKRIDIYKSKSSVPVIIEAIILYNVIHNEKVSDTIVNQFQFNSLLRYHKKLSEIEKERVFIYLYDVLLEKLAQCKTTDEKEFKEKCDTLKQVLDLLKDYNKDLENYPDIISIIKDVAHAKNDQSWTVNMKSLFDVKKTWRKLLFEESLTLCPTETVLLNVLKHGPSLIDHNKKEVENILFNKKMSLRQVLGKLKVYWPSSLANDMTIMYTDKLNAHRDLEATTRGLSILLPSKQLHELIVKYAPKKAKVNWAEIDEFELKIQQQFAKNMHTSRPQPFPETILLFAKGDYLQYALPSLLSVFYNLNSESSHKYILNMLDAPVSLQKHGIRLAVSKFTLEQLLSEFSNIWNNNKNATIRSVIFKTIFELMCKQKDSNKIQATWQLMKMFIENITFEEDKTIYKLLFEIQRVPQEVKGEFYMKSYKFLHRLLAVDEYKEYEHDFYSSFTAYTREIIEQLQPDFVVGIILEFIGKEFTKKQLDMWSPYGCVISTISSFVLCTTDEETQLERYEKVLLPILKQSFTIWDIEDFIRNNVARLLNTLRFDIKHYVIDLKKVNPIKMFLLIQDELKYALEISANYMLLTMWKLTVTFTGILHAHSPIICWDDTCEEIANEFGDKCRDYLKEDCNKHFPRIYILFAKALNRMVAGFIPAIAYCKISRSLINDKTFIQGYLAGIILVSKINLLGDDEGMKKRKIYYEGLCESIREHPSIEIKIHYYNQIKHISEQ